MREKTKTKDLVKYLDEIIECKNYFEDKDYVLHLIFKDEIERVRDLITEMNIKYIRSIVNDLKRGI